MQVRLLLKTHYQIGKPGIFSVLLTKCTSPSQSTYPEVISDRLAKIDFETIAVNKESAKFAVVMAQAFGFLTKNMFWDNKGRAIAILLDDTPRSVPPDYLRLTLTEKILYLKYYLEADGAVILEICKGLKEKGRMSRQVLLSTDFIDHVFVDIWETYRQLTTDLREKVQLKESVRKLKLQPYTKKTRLHKTLAHIDPLVDLGLIERLEEKNEISFRPKTHNSFTPIDVLVDALKTVENMETYFSKSRYFSLISKLYNIKAAEYDPKDHAEILKKMIFSTYQKARTEPSKMASIAVMSDVIGAKLLADKAVIIDRPQFEAELDSLRAELKRGVYFHVDMQGRKAFVVFDDKLFEGVV
jgi:hypothetical protein